jgi:hypothetical protein
MCGSIAWDGPHARFIFTGTRNPGLLLLISDLLLLWHKTWFLIPHYLLISIETILRRVAWFSMTPHEPGRALFAWK